MVRCLIVILVLFASSCVTQDKCIKKFPPSKTDSVSITYKDSTIYRDSVRWEVKVKDSIVITPGVKDTGSMPCNENGSYKIKTANADISIKTKNGRAYWDIDISKTESRFNSIISEKDRIISDLRVSSVVSKQASTSVVVSVVTYVPWYIKALAWIGAISLGYFLGRFLIFKFIS